VKEVPPFERRVLERISRGMASRRVAVRDQDVSHILDESRGFSSNMCDALADLVESVAVSRLDMGIAFSPEWRSDVKDDLQTFSLTQMETGILRDAAANLRKGQEPTKERVLGRITRLETEGNPSDLFKDKSPRKVEVSWVNAEGKAINVKIALAPDDDLAAVEAHKYGNIISAIGLVKKQGRSWLLDPIERFEII
jgi:hypothetical protein